MLIAIVAVLAAITIVLVCIKTLLPFDLLFKFLFILFFFFVLQHFFVQRFRLKGELIFDIDTEIIEVKLLEKRFDLKINDAEKVIVRFDGYSGKIGRRIPKVTLFYLRNVYEGVAQIDLIKGNDKQRLYFIIANSSSFDILRNYFCSKKAQQSKPTIVLFGA